MTDARFPALGFDPARGDVVTVREVAVQLDTTGTYAGEAHGVLTNIQQKRDVWTGNAADAFADKLGELPGFLDAAHDSMSGAAKALSTWADQLAAHQAKAIELEKQAQKSIDAAHRADAAAQEATVTANTPITYSPDDPAAAEAAHRQAQARAAAAGDAQRAADAAWQRVEDVRRRAQDLRDRWEDDGRICAEALQEAAERAPASGMFDDIGDWVGNTTEWVSENLGDIAGIVSAVAGALAFIPVLTPIMGPIAVGAGAVALAAHGTKMVVEGNWDDPMAWVELGGDVVGLVPGIGAVSKGLNAAGDVVAGTDKLVDVTRTGIAAVGDTAGEAVLKGGRVFADDVVQPSKAAQWVTEKATGVSIADDAPELASMATNAAKTLEGGTNVALQVPQANALWDHSPEATQAKNQATAGSFLLGAITVK